MRLIQQEPAWSLHAYLRFLNVDYNTENTFASRALGLQLPIIVDRVTTKTESLAMSYLSSKFSSAASGMTADAVFSAYLNQSLVIPFNQLRRINRTEKKNQFKVLPIGLNVAYGVMDDIRDFFCGDRFDPLPGATENELVESMARVYEEINDTLLLKIANGQAPTFTQLHGHLATTDDEESAPTSPMANTGSAKSGFDSDNGSRSPTRSQRAAMQGGGLAEAVLFGHMASVLCTLERLAAVLTRYEGLLIFFQYICTTYFTDPYLDATADGTDALHWKSSMNELLANKFLDQEACEVVKKCLLYGTPIPCTDLPENETGSGSGSSKVKSVSDFYPVGSDTLADDTNPLASPGAKRAASARATTTTTTTTTTANTIATAAAEATTAPALGSTDLYLVNDEPTGLSKLRLDLSLSAPWRNTCNNVLGLFGFAQMTAPMTMGVVPPVSSAVHTVGLGGIGLLLGVSGCFAGYAFYTTRKKR